MTTAAYFRTLARDFDASALRQIADHADRHEYVPADESNAANDAKGRLADLAAAIRAVLNLAAEDDEPTTPAATFQIFDSMDRPCSPPTSSVRALWKDLERLQHEAAEEPSRLTYAIGMIRPDGSVTFDH